MPATKNSPAAASEPPFITRLKQSFPALVFKPGTRFSYRPPRTIHYDPLDPDLPLLILHEIGHATIQADTYKTDIERLKIERAAWDAAANFCAQFGVEYDPDFVEARLDTYRDWLHAKSKCPRCGLTRYQAKTGTYHCPHCQP